MIFLFNTNIVPSEAVVRVSQISAEYAAALVASTSEITSAIGHDATADAMGTILGIPVSTNRIHAQPKGGDIAISLKINGRLPEGMILDAMAMDKIGYTLYLMQFYDTSYTIHAYNHFGDGK